MDGLVFDFDGLILDTETPELRVWEAIFAEHGLELPLGYWQTIIGRGAEQDVERPPALLARLSGASVDAADARQDRHRRIMALIASEEIRPGIVDLLDQADAAGVPKAVASSSKHDWVDGHLERLGLAGRFDAVLCADDVTRAKPFPDLYLAACGAIGVAPEKALALEDSPNGIAAARAAGVFVVVVPNSVTALLDTSEADAKLDSLAGVGLAELRALMGATRGDRHLQSR